MQQHCVLCSINPLCAVADLAVLQGDMQAATDMMMVVSGTARSVITCMETMLMPPHMPGCPKTPTRLMGGGYNHTYQQPGHSAYGHQGQFGGYGQNQHTPAPYAPHSNALNGGGFGRLS